MSIAKETMDLCAARASPSTNIIFTFSLPACAVCQLDHNAAQAGRGVLLRRSLGGVQDCIQD